MLATAVNPSVSLLFRGRTFPVKSRKIPCSQGISVGASGIRCYLLHFGDGIERYQQVGPDLFSLLARAREREAGKGAAEGDADPRLKRYAPMSPVLAAARSASKEREMARSSDTRGSDKRPPIAVGHVRLAVPDVGAAARWP
jgi:hypothetical protein